MAATSKQIQALPSHRTAPTDIEGAYALIIQVREALERGDANGLPTIEETSTAKRKLDEIGMDLTKAQDLLNTMAGYVFLAGTQVAATFQTIAGYIESRSAYLTTYLQATAYVSQSGDPNEHIVLRDSTIQGVFDMITTAVGQYAPLMLPKIFTQAPLIGGFFAIVDVARTMNDKRKSVEERKTHYLELAEAHRERGDTDEMDWLGCCLNDDRDALDDLVRSTIKMCDGLMTLAAGQSPQADPLSGAGS